MPDEIESRRIVENRLGAAFARKATPALIEALATPVAFPEAMESIDTPEAGSPADVVNPPVILEIATAAIEAKVAEESVSSARQAAVAAARADFERHSAEIRQHLQIPGRESFAPPRVEICWLANAIRTRYQAERLAEIADHDAVETIDIPRQIYREQSTVFIGEIMRVPQFRTATGLTGKGVLLAVIDGEALRDVSVFQTRLDAKNNFSVEPWGKPDNHGTAVAAIVGANSSLITGMAPEALIHNYKIFATDKNIAEDFDGALAIQQALEDGVQVANCSWGAGTAGSGTSREARACDRAWTLGMVVVKSAGNRGPSMNTLTTPADAAGIIVVGGTVPDGTRVGDYSSRGTTPNGARPHLVAPGGDSTLPLQGLSASGKIGAIGHGTSFAAPHVTGALALLLESDPAATPDQLRATLLSMCTPITGVNAVAQGAGLLLFP